MHINKDVNLSYWELKSYFKIYDLIVIGGGLVGLNAALTFAKHNRQSKILVLEAGVLPNGASTKNAGFACFGSAGELLDDLQKMPEDAVWETVEMRWKGLQLLRKNLGDKTLNYQASGGHELFKTRVEYEKALNGTTELNEKIKSITGKANCFKSAVKTGSQFTGIKGAITNSLEGLLDTAAMMEALVKLTRKQGVEMINGIAVQEINDVGNNVELLTEFGVFKSNKVIVATNGFASRLVNLNNIRPARAQVLITKPIKNIGFKGGFHYHMGYYYFRCLDGRLLLGGGRHLDFEGETTDIQGLNSKIQKSLDTLLKHMILPGIKFEVEARWSGIMGVGSEKKPIIEAVSKNVMAAVRMGGMGVAIGSLVGKYAAKKIM